MEFEERATDPLAGGIMRGYQCGATWGAALGAGAQAYRLFGADVQAEAMAIVAAQRAVEFFRDQNEYINCREITGIDMTSASMGAILRFIVKGAPTGSCFGMTARYASAVFGEINTALSQEPPEALPAPISCSAVLAQKMGASEMHTVMAAGLAGGIGLSGSGCGALGTAIWITGIDILKRGEKFNYQAPHAAEAIASFLKCTGDEFECAKIVGRKFESISDHAGYLRDGGCSKIIEALAARE